MLINQFTISQENELIKKKCYAFDDKYARLLTAHVMMKSSLNLVEKNKRKDKFNQVLANASYPRK